MLNNGFSVVWITVYSEQPGNGKDSLYKQGLFCKRATYPNHFTCNVCNDTRTMIIIIRSIDTLEGCPFRSKSGINGGPNHGGGGGGVRVKILRLLNCVGGGGPYCRGTTPITCP